MKSQIRINRVRAKIKHAPYPRLVVFRSNKYIYAQIVGMDGRTVAGRRGREAAKVGQDIAGLVKKTGVKKVVFDRGSYKYHGQVKTLAEAARKGGLEF